MQYTITKQRIEWIGRIWLPPDICAQQRDLRQYDMDNIGDPSDRDDVECWLLLNSGDFQSVIDFHADFDLPDGRHIEHPWHNPESEFTFNDCMYPAEEA